MGRGTLNQTPETISAPGRTQGQQGGFRFADPTDALVSKGQSRASCWPSLTLVHRPRERARALRVPHLSCCHTTRGGRDNASQAEARTLSALAEKCVLYG